MASIRRDRYKLAFIRVSEGFKVSVAPDFGTRCKTHRFIDLFHKLHGINVPYAASYVVARVGVSNGDWKAA
jgi:hypothetical protein